MYCYYRVTQKTSQRYERVQKQLSKEKAEKLGIERKQREEKQRRMEEKAKRKAEAEERKWEEAIHKAFNVKISPKEPEAAQAVERKASLVLAPVTASDDENKNVKRTLKRKQNKSPNKNQNDSPNKIQNKQQEKLQSFQEPVHSLITCAGCGAAMAIKAGSTAECSFCGRVNQG